MEGGDFTIFGKSISDLAREIGSSERESTDGGSSGDGESTDGDGTDGESTDGESTDGESTDGESTGGESTGGENTDGEDTGEDSISDEDDERPIQNISKGKKRKNSRTVGTKPTKKRKGGPKPKGRPPKVLVKKKFEKIPLIEPMIGMV
jgi:hypothetical protein